MPSGPSKTKLALDPEEENAIEIKREFINGRARVIANPALSLAPKELAFADAEAARIRQALEIWARYDVNIDRKWLEPLLDVILSPEPKSEKQSFRLP